MRRQASASQRLLSKLHPNSVIALKQALMVTALIAVTWIISMAHLAVVARPLFVLASIILSIIYIRRSPWQYLTFSLWIWTLAPFMRRICDYYSAPVGFNIVLIAPNIISLIMLPSLLTSRTLLKRKETAVGLLLLGPSIYGLCVSFVISDIFPGMVGAIDWITPLIYFWFIIDNAETIDELKPYFDVFIPLNLAIISLYGIYQNYFPPAWDLKYWNFLKGEEEKFTTIPIFSTLNFPGICATWVALLILLSLGFGGGIAFFVLPTALLMLVMTEVRSAVGALVFGLILAMTFGRGRLVQALLGIFAALFVFFGLFASLDQDLATRLTRRFASVGDLEHDGSANARKDLIKNTPNIIANIPFGMGTGSVGKGARAEAGKKFVDMDSGIVAPFIVFGWFFGAFYGFGLAAIVARCAIAAKRSGSQTALVLSIGAIASAATSLFTMNVGIQGLMLWMCIAYAIAIEVQEHNKRIGASSLLRDPTNWRTRERLILSADRKIL